MPVANPPINQAAQWRVLIVEDDAFLSTLYASFLQGKSLDCQVAASTSMAEQLIQTSEPFNLILLDQELPDGLGLDLLPSIKKFHPLAPVIMISGNEEAEFFIQAFNQGVDDYIVKPINIELLWIKVIKLLERRQMQQQILKQKNQLSRWQDEKKIEFFITQHLMQHVLDKVNQANPAIQQWNASSTELSGDLFLQRRAVDGSWYCFLADATGHGLAAAVSLMPVIDIFKESVDQLHGLTQMIYRINQQLGWYIPNDRFVACLAVHVQPQKNLLEFWNAGMPAALLAQTNGKIMELHSQSLALGIVSNQQLRAQVSTLALDQCQSLLLYSDGLIETPLNNNDYLSLHSLSDRLANLSSSQCFEQLLILAMDQLAPRALDDISLAMLDFGQLQQQEFSARAESEQASSSLCLGLQGALLERFHYLPLIEAFLKPLNLMPRLYERVVLVCCELIKNAYEHGVQSLLSKGEGSLSQQRIDLLLEADLEQQCLTLRLTDSGEGFAHQELQTLDSQPNDSRGRGLILAKHFSQRLEYNSAGNSVEAQWQWGDTEEGGVL